MLTSARPPIRAWEVARTVVAPPLSVVKCLWEVFVWGFCCARVCAGVGGVFSVGVSCVRVACALTVLQSYNTLILYSLIRVHIYNVFVYSSHNHKYIYIYIYQDPARIPEQKILRTKYNNTNI